ncbi:MAG TPA: penicillin-binding transpeptidase domain-containing protein [Bryobacteraceae bacterium]|nr:penicillin-binding transpeptidase domain-containing protein [Bryobacteraceae bacterium]
MRIRKRIRLLFLLGFSVAFAAAMLAAQPKAKTAANKKATASTKAKAAPAKAAPTAVAKKAAPRKQPRRVRSPWSEPTFADSTAGDDISGEDLTVRRAAVQALGPYNGSVVAVDPLTGRVLTMVNQKVALQSGFQPCSTVKLPVAVAGLIEGVIERDTPVRVQADKRLTLTEALARSDNPFFATLGTKLGFARFSYYARLLGFGERAGLGIEGERLGAFPQTPPAGTPVGLMASFGTGIALTPLQLAAMLSTFSNGGTLYYLQYPRSLEEVRDFRPKVKRQLAIGQWVADIRPGMMAAVEYGTARRANYDATEPVFGKTGTCTDNRTHLGWFGSFNLVGRNRLVVVVLLTGGQGVSGPAAAEIAGNMYKRLSQESFFAGARDLPSTALASVASCCVR